MESPHLCLCVCVHCRGSLGHTDGGNNRRTAEGADSHHARDLCQGCARGPTGNQERVRVSRVQDPHQRTHLHLDLQPQDQREARQVGAGCSLSPAQRIIHGQTDKIFSTLFISFQTNNKPLQFYTMTAVD